MIGYQYRYPNGYFIRISSPKGPKDIRDIHMYLGYPYHIRAYPSYPYGPSSQMLSDVTSFKVASMSLTTASLPHLPSTAALCLLRSNASFTCPRPAPPRPRDPVTNCPTVRERGLLSAHKQRVADRGLPAPAFDSWWGWQRRGLQS